jgi:hypothetical protein
MKKKIYCWLPHNDSVIKSDTSFCNRIIQWEYCHLINIIYDFQFEIILNEKTNKDLKLFFDLPNTSYQLFDINKIQENTTDLANVFIDSNEIVNRTYDLHENVYLFGYVDMRVVTSNIRKKYNTLDFIKKSNLYKKIKKQIDGHNYVGLHLRRGRGVNIPNSDIIELEQNIKEEFIDYKKRIANGLEENLLTISDKSIMDILEYYKTYGYTNFYLSTDVPKKFCTYFFEKIDKLKTFDDFGSYNSTIPSYIYDFLFLANCEIKIGSDFSSYFDLACEINNTHRKIDYSPLYLYRVKQHENNISNR